MKRQILNEYFQMMTFLHKTESGIIHGNLYHLPDEGLRVDEIESVATNVKLRVSISTRLTYQMRA